MRRKAALPVQLALAHPHLTGVGSDLEVVRPVFNDYIARFDLQSRLRFESCDVFKDALPKAEVYIFGHMLHGWGLDDKRKMVAKVFDTLPKGGADRLRRDDRR